MQNTTSNPNPKGVLVQCVAHVTQDNIPGNTQSGDVRMVENQLTLVPPPESSIAESNINLDAIYQGRSEAVLPDIFDRHVASLLNAFVQGVSGCCLALGGCDSQKSQLMRQLVPLIADGVFEFIAQKQDESRTASTGETNYRYEAKFSVIELFNEVATDLLRPANHDLAVEDHYLNGVVTKGSVEKTVRTADEMIMAFEEADGARNTSRTDFGPASNYTATIFTIDLVQYVTTGGGQMDRIASRFQFVEVPGTDKLLIEPDELRTLEGNTLNKSLLTFQNICRGLAGQQGKEFISHRSSNFTHLLVDALGGNCVTLCIAHLNQHQFDSNRATIGLLHSLQKVSNYPVMNDGHLQGLLCRYRLSMEEIQDKIDALRSDKKGQELDKQDDVMLRLTELEGRLIKDNLEKIQLKDDKHQVYEKLMEFRTKYNELVQSKSDVQKSLLDTEEEKLRLSKALLDLKIEASQQAEKTEQEKYDLVTKLLNAENDILELEMREQNREKVDETLKEQLQKLTDAKKQLTIEFVTLKSNYIDRNKECQQAQSKVKQLGVELLSLVNQKNVLTQQKDQLERTKKQTQEQQQVAQEQLATLKADLDQLKSRVVDQEQGYDQLRNEKTRLELDLKHSTIALESRKLETDKNTEDFSRERDAELYDMKKRHELEVTRAATEKAALQSQHSTLQAQLRQEQRKTIEFQAALERKGQEELKLTTENSELRQSSQVLADNFRVKLLQYIQEADHADSDGSKQQNMLDELLATYQGKEGELTSQVDELRQRNHEVVRKNRLLYEKFKAIRYQLEDLNPGTQLPDLPDEKDIRSGDPTELEAEMERETKLMSDKVRSTQSELTKQQEKALQMAETFRITIAGLEKKCVELAAAATKLQSENVELQQRVSTTDNGGNQNATALAQMKELQQTLLQQMAEIKTAQSEAAQKALQAPAQQPAVPQYVDQELVDNLKRENSKLKDKVQDAESLVDDLQSKLKRAEKRVDKAESQVEQYKDQASSSPAPAPAASVDTEPAEFTFTTSEADLVKMKTMGAQIEDLNKKLLAQRGASDVAKELGEAERRCAEYVSRNAMLEEELKSFKNYMQNVTTKYKKQIAKLKKKA